MIFGFTVILIELKIPTTSNYMAFPMKMKVQMHVYICRHSKCEYTKSRLTRASNVSLPQLELCVALLYAELISSVIKIILRWSWFFLLFDRLKLIATGFLRWCTSTWKTFVVNRIADINRSLKQYKGIISNHIRIHYTIYTQYQS